MLSPNPGDLTYSSHKRPRFGLVLGQSLKGVQEHPAVILVFGAALVPGLAYGDFKQPGGGVYCGPSRTAPIGLLCWRSKTGLTVKMNATGRVVVDTIRKNRNLYEDSAPPLRVGRKWRFRDSFFCSMAKAGLTCKNKSKHGWFMGRTTGYKIF